MEQPHRIDKFSLQNPGRKTPDFEEQRHKHIMGKLKGTIFTNLSASNPPRPISQGLKCHVERRLHEFFPRFDIPSHPPYSLMIQTAITELNEGGGSTEESISWFVEKNYEDLPWGHAAFLRHHLRKLCGTGEIVCINGRRFMIAVDQGRVEEQCCVEGKEDEMVNKRNKEREKQIEGFEEQCQVEKQAGEEKNEASRWGNEATEQEIELCYEEERQYQHIKMNEEPCNLQELRFDVSHKHTLSCSPHGSPQPVMEAEKKDDLELTEQQRTRSPCTGRASDAKVSERENKLQEHQIQGETEVLGLCCVNREDLGENLRVSLGNSSLPVLKRQRKQFSKQWRQQQQRKTVNWEENKVVIVCGLQAQKKAPNSHPYNKQQQQSQDTTMAVFLPLEQQHDIEQHYHHQPQCRGQGCPSEREGEGERYRSPQIYVRRRRRG